MKFMMNVTSVYGYKSLIAESESQSKRLKCVTNTLKFLYT